MKRKKPPPPAFDPALKTLVEISPPDWVQLFAQPMGATKVLDAEVATTVRGAADKVIRVGGKPSYLLHLDFQAGKFAAHQPRSLHLRNVALQFRHRLVVVTGLVLLKPEADSPRWTGELHSVYPGRNPETTFRYHVLRVWEHPPEFFLQGVGTMPLAPVSAVTKEQIPEIIRAMEFALAEHPLKQEVLVASHVLLGLRYSEEFASLILPRILEMKESTTYQAIVAEGKAEGLVLGKAEGEMEATRKLLIRLGRARFGPPSKANLAFLKNINDLSLLEDLGDRLLIVNSWQELLKTNGRH